MNENDEMRRRARDTDLVDHFVDEAETIRLRMREWIQEELIQMAREADVLDTLMSPGRNKERLAQIRERIRVMNESELRYLDQRLKDNNGEINYSNAGTPLEARSRLEDGMSSMKGMMHELLVMRETIALYATEYPGSPTPL
jgi:hypothetical protein